MAMAAPDYRTQKTLIERLKDRYDETAWAEYVVHYQYFIYSILLKMGFSHHDAEDLKQEVLLRSWKGMENFEYNPAKCRFRTWLSLITRNHAKNYFASKSAKLESLKSKEGIKLLEVEEVSQSDIDRFIAKEWEKHITKLAWDAVSKNFNEKALEVYLAMTREEPVDKIAEKFDISEGSTYVYKQRVHRALCKEICSLDRDLG